MKSNASHSLRFWRALFRGEQIQETCLSPEVISLRAPSGNPLQQAQQSEANPSKKATLLKSTGAAACFMLSLALSVPALAATIRVPADYATIQSAVDAASSGDTIQIAGGVYAEQILIVSKNLTLSGQPGAIIRAFVGMAQTLLPYDGEPRAPLLGIVSSEAVVTGLAFEGEHLADAHTYSMVGVYYRGSSGRVENCRVEGFRGRVRLESSSGWGVKIANYSAGGPLVKVQVLNCIFGDNKRSVGVSGDDNAATSLRTSFTVQDNTITGIGPTDNGDELGIMIGAGASGNVTHNRIADHYSTAAGLAPSLGVFASDWIDVNDTRPRVALQPVHYENNTFVSNHVALASFTSSTSQIVNNMFQGSGNGNRFDIGLAVSGDRVNIATNRFSNLTRGVTLFGNDPDFGTMFGTSTNPQVTANRFCEVTDPVEIEPLVTGVSQQGTQFCPFPPPTLAIGAAVILSWPSDSDGWALEAAPVLTGPWTLTGMITTQQGGQNIAAVYTDSNHRFFRLERP
jgi:hypothetical protein